MTDGCKFSTEEIMGAKNVNYTFKFSRNKKKILGSNFAFLLKKIFPTKNFEQAKFWGLGGISSYILCHNTIK